MGKDGGFFVPPSMRQGHGGPPPQHYPQNGGHGRDDYGRDEYDSPPGPPPGYYQQNQNGGYGAPPPGPPQGYRPPPPNGRYGGPPPPQQGYSHRPAPPQGYNSGPPPHHRPPPGRHGGPPPPGYGGPPPHQQQGGGGGGNDGPWRPPKIGVTRLTRTSWLWTRYNADGEVCCEIGPQCKGEALYSCKFGMSGRTKLKVGEYDRDGPLVGEVAVKGTFVGKYLPTFNGFETELKNAGYSLTGSVKCYAFDIPINGRTERFEWRPHDKSIAARLSDQKGWELKRKGASESSPPLVIYKDQEGNGFSDKTKMGTVEFQGAGATGEMGDMFPNLVILTLLNIRQQRHVENMASAVGG